MHASGNNSTSFVFRPYWQYGFLGGVLTLTIPVFVVIAAFGFIDGRIIPAVAVMLLSVLFAFGIYFFALRLAMIRVIISLNGIEIKRGETVICPYRRWESFSKICFIAITQENSKYTNTSSGRYFVAFDATLSESEYRDFAKTLKGQIPEGKHGNNLAILLDGDMVRKIKQFLNDTIYIHEYPFAFKEFE